MEKRIDLNSMIFTIILATIFFSPLGKGGEIQWAVLARHSAIVIMISLWIMNFMRIKSPYFRIMGLELPILSLFLISIISYLHSNYRYSTQLEITNMVLYVSYMFICLQVMNRSRMSTLSWAIVVSCTIQAIVAIWERYIHGIDPPEVRGTFFNPNYAANFMLVGLNIAFLQFFRGQGKKGVPFWSMGIMGLVILWGIIVTGSRSAAIAMIALLCFHLLSLGRRWIPAIALFLFIILVIPNPVKERLIQFRFSEESDMHPLERVEIWKQSTRMILDNPLLGVSLGNFEDHTYPYNFPVDRSPARYGMRFTTAHNGILQIGAEMGFPGILSALWILFAIFRKAIKGFQNERDEEMRFYLYTASTSLIAMVIPALVSDNIYSPPIVLLALTMTSFISYISIREEGNESMKSNKRWKTLMEGNMIISPVCSLFLVVLLVCIWPFFCLNPYLGNLHFQKAETEMKKGRMEMAENFIKMAIYYSPDQPYYYQLLGRINLIRFESLPSEENLKGAIFNLSRAMDINSMQPDFSFHMAKALEAARAIALRTDELDKKIIEYYEKAISLAPKNPFYPFNLALFYMKIDRYYMALGCLKRAIELEPNFINAHNLLWLIYTRQGNMEKAREEERILSSLIKRFENYKPRSRYEELLFMRPEVLFGQGKLYGELNNDRRS